jgi:hypothetical protein
MLFWLLMVSPLAIAQSGSYQTFYGSAFVYQIRSFERQVRPNNSDQTFPSWTLRVIASATMPGYDQTVFVIAEGSLVLQTGLTQLSVNCLGWQYLGFVYESYIFQSGRGSVSEVATPGSNTLPNALQKALLETRDRQETARLLVAACANKITYPVASMPLYIKSGNPKTTFLVGGHLVELSPPDDAVLPFKLRIIPEYLADQTRGRQP